MISNDSDFFRPMADGPRHGFFGTVIVELITGPLWNVPSRNGLHHRARAGGGFLQTAASKRSLSFWAKREGLAKELHFAEWARESHGLQKMKTAMTNLNEIKITPRDQQVLRLLVQGCSNKEIAAQLEISPRTVKQHLRTLFLRAGIKEGRKRVRLATAMFQKEQMESCHQGTD